MSDSHAAASQGIDPRFDVAVVGAGPVGLLIGLGLARAGLSVAVAAAETLDAARRPAVDARAYAIGAATWRIFDAFGLGPELAPFQEAIELMSVVDSRREGGGGAPHWRRTAFGLDFDAAEQHASGPLGYVIEDGALRRVLMAAALAQPGLSLIGGAAAEGAVFGPHQAALSLADGRRLVAPLIVAADGKRSVTREAAGIRTYGLSYHQSAVVAVLRLPSPHAKCARQIFLPEGPLALLPMTDGRVNLILSARQPLAAALMRLTPAAFLEELIARGGDDFRGASLESERFAFPLGLQIAAEFARPRLALAGDCAHVIHPLAGQGLNLGLRDAAVLLETLIHADRLGLDLGFFETLKPYARRRRADVMKHVAVTHAINRLFSNHFPPFAALRGPGLALAGALAPARAYLMREASGDGAAAPAIMRGFALWEDPGPGPETVATNSAQRG